MIPRLPLPRLARSFSTTPHVHKVFSIIGREPIKFPPTVTLTPSPSQITITGPLGTTAVPLKEYMSVAFPEEHTMKLTVARAAEKLQRQMWGTTRTLIANAIVGMTEGFTIPIYLVGVGYRVALEDDPRGTTDGGNGQRLNMKLGYSHPVYVPIPEYIKAEVPTATKIVLTCTDKHLIGLFAAKIRGYRKPEPYKGKVSCLFVRCLHASLNTGVRRVSSSGTKPSVSRASRKSRRSIHHTRHCFPILSVLILLL